MKNLFYRKPMIKKINELYYTNHSKEKYSSELKWAFPLREDESQNNLLILREDVNDFTTDEELRLMIEDLILLDRQDNFKAFTSKLGRELVNKYKKALYKVQSRYDTLSDNTRELMKVLKNEFEEDSYIVGGWVRDAISDRESHDVDFCTSIPYDKLEEVFVKKGFKVVDAGKQFLVLNVYVNGELFEIAALRRDNYTKKPKFVRRIKS